MHFELTNETVNYLLLKYDALNMIYEIQMTVVVFLNILMTVEMK